MPSFKPTPPINIETFLNSRPNVEKIDPKRSFDVVEDLRWEEISEPLKEIYENMGINEDDVVMKTVFITDDNKMHSLRLTIPKKTEAGEERNSLGLKNLVFEVRPERYVGETREDAVIIMTFNDNLDKPHIEIVASKPPNSKKWIIGRMPQ